jgi:hypothetical protein
MPSVLEEVEEMRPFHFFLVALVLVPIAYLQPKSLSSSPAESRSAASPEMDRLSKVLVGDWDTTETMERSEFFPNGGSRKGYVHARLASGGYRLIYEVHSDGSAGVLDGFLTIWWDKNTSLFYFLACFNNANSPCRMRGTAHWEGDSFVNDYEETIKMKRTSWRDSFTFTPTAHKLVAAAKTDGSAMQTLITTRATRR